MFCQKCGKQLNDDASVCTGCGCATTPKKAQKGNKNVGTRIACILAGVAIIIVAIILAAGNL